MQDVKFKIDFFLLQILVLDRPCNLKSVNDLF